MRVAATARSLRFGSARVLALNLAVAVAYVLAVQIAGTVDVAVAGGSVSPVWLGTAVGLVAVLRWGRSIVPGLLLGIVAGDAVLHLELVVLIATAAGNLAEPFVILAVLRRLGSRTGSLKAIDLARFALAALVGAILSAAAGVGSLWATGAVSTDELASTTVLWTLGVVAGAICVAPLGLLPGRRGHAERFESGLIALFVLALSVAVLAGDAFQPYWMFPALMWAGLRLGPRGAALIVFIVTGVSVAAAAAGTGPFVKATPAATLLAAQAFIIVAAATTLLLATITEDRRRAARALRESEADKRMLAEEQSALRRVAEHVAGAQGSTPVFDYAAREVVRLLGVELVAVIEYRHGETVHVLAEAGRAARPGVVGTQMPLIAGGPVAEARGGEIVHQRLADEDALPLALADRVAAPIFLDGAAWGAVLVCCSERRADLERIEGVLRRVADIVALAVAEARARQRLLAQAETDPLTGLTNHRAFHERLSEETARALRHGRPLSVAIIDIDHFKAINDSFGHALGDRVLSEVARRLQAASRHGELVGRVGGDELAVIVPEVEGVAAHRAVDRLRREISRSAYADVGVLTASAGVCDLTETQDAEQLFRFADGALYWAKAHGRDICFRYSPDVVRELSADEKAERLQRSQALSGIRALARAIDAKDPATIRHSERVAELVGRLAQGVGWEPRRVALLQEAGLVHDVGKIGVPDAILFQPGRLSEAEYAEVKRHAVLGEDIAREVLGAEQASWIRAHHERPDGRGYPDGLTELSEGAQLLSLADAWDAMTRARSYSAPMTLDAGLEECNAQAGRQFTEWAVAALNELHADGTLARLGSDTDVSPAERLD